MRKRRTLHSNDEKLVSKPGNGEPQYSCGCITGCAGILGQLSKTKFWRHEEFRRKEENAEYLTQVLESQASLKRAIPSDFPSGGSDEAGTTTEKRARLVTNEEIEMEDVPDWYLEVRVLFMCYSVCIPMVISADK
jgi:hypothetical protein